LFNELTNEAFVKFLNVQPGMRVLEVGSGLGLLAATVAQSAPDVQVVAVERSAVQIKAAVKAPAVLQAQGDAHHLQFPDASFDLVYARYVLEHVADPETVLKEMRRVARHGGRVVACENDSSLIRFDPECPGFEKVWSAFRRYQATLGGDSDIGRRLYRLFHRAGLSQIELSVQTEIHWNGSPGYDAWLTNIIGNVQSARCGIVSSGLCSDDEIAGGIAELAALSHNVEGSSIFVWNRAAGRNL
jgi:SAM-dependent methyltransferase